MNRLLPALCALAVLLAPALGQRLNDRDKPVNHPVNCPYTGGDAAMLEQLGIVSIGGFPFGMKASTQEQDEDLLAKDIRWVETKHFKIGFGLSSYKVTQEEKKDLREELHGVAEHWDEVDPKMRTIDPWMRAYLFALRIEAFYDEFQELLGVEDADFPDGTQLWDTTGKYMGTGPYLGMNAKYEVLVLPTGAATRDYLRRNFGLKHERTQRWNILDKGIMQLIIPAEDHLRKDRALHGHLRFNLAQILLNGYRHYSYDLPIWLREGLAHYMERKLSGEFNTFDSSEGAVAEMTRKKNWEPEVRKLVQKEGAPSLARLMALRDFAGLDLADHFTTWSMIDYLQKKHPGFLAKLIDRISGLLNEKFIPDGSALPDVHREVFREELGMTYAQFDRAWRTWVLETYAPR